MNADYTVKAGAVPGPLRVGLSYSDGTTPDLTPPGTTVVFRMGRFHGGPAVLTAAAAIVDASTVQYVWQAGNLTLPEGLYEAEFQVTWTSGRKDTFPAAEEHPYILIRVEPVIS